MPDPEPRTKLDYWVTGQEKEIGTNMALLCKPYSSTYFAHSNTTGNNRLIT